MSKIGHTGASGANVGSTGSKEEVKPAETTEKGVWEARKAAPHDVEAAFDTSDEEPRVTLQSPKKVGFTEVSEYSSGDIGSVRQTTSKVRTKEDSEHRGFNLGSSMGLSLNTQEDVLLSLSQGSEEFRDNLQGFTTSKKLVKAGELLRHANVLKGEVYDIWCSALQQQLATELVRDLLGRVLLQAVTDGVPDAKKIKNMISRNFTTSTPWDLLGEKLAKLGLDESLVPLGILGKEENHNIVVMANKLIKEDWSANEMHAELRREKKASNTISPFNNIVDEVVKELQRKDLTTGKVMKGLRVKGLASNKVLLKMINDKWNDHYSGG